MRPATIGGIRGTLAVAVALSGWVFAQDRPTFSTKVEAVRVDVLVTDGGRPVSGLTLADFDVFDNGVRQQPRLATLEQMPINVTLALDASNSVTGDRLAGLRAASLAVVDGLRPADRAALVTFNHRVSLASPLTDAFDRIRSGVQRLEPAGGTALFDAIFTGIVFGESDGGRSLLLVFTDGSDTASLLRPDDVLAIASRTDIVIYAAVAGLWGRESGLEPIVWQTGGRVSPIDSSEALVPVFVKILKEFRERYLLSYEPTGVAKGGWHRIEVRTKNRKLSVKARAGYEGPGRP